MRDAIASLRVLIVVRSRALQTHPYLFRFPATILLLAVIIVIGFFTKDMSARDHRHLIEHVGFDYANLRSVHIWHVLTGAWFQSEPGIQLSMILMVGSAAIALEYLIGSVRALTVMIAGDWISTVLTAIGLRMLSALGSNQATTLLSHADAGSSVLAHTGWATAAMILPSPIGPIAYSLLLLVSVSQFWWQELAPASAHLFGVIVGGIIAWRFLKHATSDPATAPLPDMLEVVSS